MAPPIHPATVRVPRPVLRMAQSVAPAWIAVLAAGCAPDTSTIRVRGNGLEIEVRAMPGPDPAHARTFEITVDPRAPTALRCASADDPDEVHQRDIGGISDEAVTLYGLLADTDWDCTVTATGDKGALTADVPVRTEPAATPPPDWQVDGAPGASWGAYTLFNHWRSGKDGSDHHLVIVDDAGRVRWDKLLEEPNGVGVEVGWLDGESLVIGGGDTIVPRRETLGGDVLWQIAPPTPPDWDYHHDAHVTPWGTVLALSATTNLGAAGSWNGVAVTEHDPETGSRLWRWSSQQGVDAGILPPSDKIDAYHTNAVSPVDDELGRGVLLSMRNLDQIVRVDQATGEIVWVLGPGGDFELLEGTWFSGQHDPEWDGNRVVMHDNGSATEQSRIAEFEIDPVARTARMLWEWSEQPGWYEPAWGDADRLPDGTVLVARGHCKGCDGSGSGASRVQVIDPVTGEIRWRLLFDRLDRGVYRAERIDGCALFDNLRYCPEGSAP